MATFFIAAGGTGGHIYPGVALAEALKKIEPSSQIYFIGTPHGLENRIVGGKGFPILHLNIGRLNKNVSRGERIRTILQLPLSFIKSLKLLFKYKPDTVIGVGGHASGPILLMASLLRTPTVIWEPNAMPGMANRMLAQFVTLACVVFEEAKLHMRARRFFDVGLPLRSEIEAFANDPPEISSSSAVKVLIMGGSQGARGINRMTVEFLNKNPEWLEFNQLTHQTGATEFEEIKIGYGNLLQSKNLKVTPFIDDMAATYSWADFVISRSGTGTLAELAATGKPSVLIPFPFSSDNHQQKNAEAFVRGNAALMILQKDLTETKFRETLQTLQSDVDMRKRLAKNVRLFFKPLAAQKMATEIFNLIRPKGRPQKES